MLIRWSWRGTSSVTHWKDSGGHWYPETTFSTEYAQVGLTTLVGVILISFVIMWGAVYITCLCCDMCNKCCQLQLELASILCVWETIYSSAITINSISVVFIIWVGRECWPRITLTVWANLIYLWPVCIPATFIKVPDIDLSVGQHHHQFRERCTVWAIVAGYSERPKIVCNTAQYHMQLCPGVISARPNLLAYAG